jgi:twitching motility protein PilU
MDLTQLFKYMSERRASDVYLSANAPVLIKIEGETHPISTQMLNAEMVKKAAYSLMTPEQIQAFEATNEMNFGLTVPAVGKFRVNIFRQRGDVALVARYIPSVVPGLDILGLPPVLKEQVMERRGLILVVGQTGSGKSTTLAAMIDYRNAARSGHILTIEDPIEYVHGYKKSIVNQREVGVDTASYAAALVNAVREAPDVLMIGEIRTRDTMEQAMIYAETGHLLLATLHANNSYHTLNRIIHFFPLEARDQLLHDLSLSLRCVISQRLVHGMDGKRLPAAEVLLNTSYIAELIKNGDIEKIKEAMEQSITPGSQTFEQSLYRLYRTGKISLDEALRNADSPTNLSWLINNPPKEEEDRVAAEEAGAAGEFSGFDLTGEKS